MPTRANRLSPLYNIWQDGVAKPDFFFKFSIMMIRFENKIKIRNYASLHYIVSHYMDGKHIYYLVTPSHVEMTIFLLNSQTSSSVVTPSPMNRTASLLSFIYRFVFVWWVRWPIISLCCTDFILAFTVTWLCAVFINSAIFLNI